MRKRSVARCSVLVLASVVTACGDRGGASPGPAAPAGPAANAMPSASSPAAPPPPSEPVAAAPAPESPPPTEAAPPDATEAAPPAASEPPASPEIEEARYALEEQIRAACSKYLTNRDVKQVCGRTVKLDIAWRDGDLPGNALSTCTREVAPVDGLSPLRIDLQVTSDARAEVNELESSPIEGWSARKLADFEAGAIATMRDGNERVQLVYVAKGDVLIRLSSRTFARRPPCTDDQLAKLARTVMARLP